MDFNTYTILFLDYDGEYDYDTYTAKDVDEAVKLFTKDHPGRYIGFVGRGLHHQAKNQCLQLMLEYCAGRGARYLALATEDTTEYTFTEEAFCIDDETAIAVLELGLQEAQAARAEEGGFGLTGLGIYRMFPFKLIKDWTEGE